MFSDLKKGFQVHTLDTNTRPITMETTDTTVTDLRCVEVADVAEVVLIEEQTQRIQLIRNM